MQQHPELTGMSARTLRAIWHSRHRIDAQFRRNPVNRKLFLQILQQPRGIVHELRRMTMLNILPRYLPVFRRIVGQMQHDLFHAYTVDQHTLAVVRNLRRFTMPEHAQEYPLASQLIAGLTATGCCMSRRCSMTSPRAAAAITRTRRARPAPLRP